MSEYPKILPAANPVGKTPAPVNAPVAGRTTLVSAPQPAVAPVSASQSLPTFGGHRGGGKKRLDGLPAGSPEAKEADRKADALRKKIERDKKRGAALPPPLPSVAGAPVNPVIAPVDGGMSLPAVVDGLAVPAVAPVAVVFVPWSMRLLEKPAKLLTKILDRARCWSLAKKVRALKLLPKDETEILDGLKWQEAAANDFSAALAECAQVELNKRRIPGAENSHLINLAMCAGELATAHFATLDRLEKMMADKAAAEKAEKIAAEKKAQNK